MKKDLAEALDLENSTDGQLPEKTRDLHRAFKMMISKMDSDRTDFKEKVGCFKFCLILLFIIGME